MARPTKENKSVQHTTEARIAQRNARAKKLIRKYLDKWLEAGFNWWKIDVDYEYDRDHKGRDTAARCKVNWEYRDVLITFYIPSVSNMTESEVENLVVHELSHILIASIQDYTDDNAAQMTEFATTNVATALMFAADYVKGTTKGKGGVRQEEVE